MRHAAGSRFAKSTRRFVLALLMVMLVSSVAWASVRKLGDWPDADQPVSFQVHEVPRTDAIKHLAGLMGWSIMLEDLGRDPVSIDVRDQPAGKVLDRLLADKDYVARRDGTLVSIVPEADAKVAISPSQPAHDVGPKLKALIARGADDRVVSGGSLRIEAGEMVGDVVVFGGSLDMYGKATGDLSVMGGSARIHDGAEVHGDASALGGSLTIDDGARVDGDVDVLGGSLNRGKGATILGDVFIDSDDGQHDAASKIGQVALGLNQEHEPGTLARLADDAQSALTRTGLLFLLGVIFLALATRRMEALELEVAARPMRSLALGIVGVLGSAVLAIALCVTVVGIPAAIVGVMVAVVLAYVGACAVLMTVGQALLRHRTTNRYIHLAVGCALFMLFGAIPYFGTLVTLVVVLMGFGALVATRGAGLLPIKDNGPEQGPYRTAPVP